MVERGSGVILFTGATSAIRGRAGAIAFSSAKFAVRGFGHWHERWVQKGFMSPIFLDGVIDTPSVRERYQLSEDEPLLLR